MVAYQSGKDEIKRAADIVALIGESVRLKKAGRNYVGLCPFHAEKDPSFTVSPERQTFHCYGCKRGGDIFSFWMEYHGSTFPEALRDLAEKYQIPLKDRFSASAEKKKSEKREALFKINELAAGYFQEVLHHPARGKPGRDYLRERSLSRDIMAVFRLGYAPDEWDGLIKSLTRNGIALEMAAEAGVVIPKKNGGYYDRFRGRIIFPIFDTRMKVVGFGGRVLDDSLPKYVNTPETDLFHKGEFLYGLHCAHKAIREGNRAVIVEGYMDCLALKREGIEEVVATLGTALTDRHVRKLKGYAKESIVVFDSDTAGKTAALKSLPIFSNEGQTARAVVLPDGHDPDSFVTQYGGRSFSELLDRALPMLDFFLDQRVSRGGSDEDKVRSLTELLPLLLEIRSFALRSLYVQRVAEMTGIKEQVILSELDKHRKDSSGNGHRAVTARSESKPRDGDDNHFLNLIIHYPQILVQIADLDWKILLSDPVVIEIVECFFRTYNQKRPFLVEDLIENINTENARQELREALLLPPFHSDQEAEMAVTDFRERIHQKQISRAIKGLKKQGTIKLEALNQLLKMKSRVSRES
ncbi:MAG: DNA primase [Desulfatiglans sp.]|jgi:DNA primase|nr:DNA primase [Thermodesulfobacteriota bacterium]MEE4353787.1 DNA primase [Desulfatiglans sp.]